MSVKSTIMAFATVLATAGTASASLVIESWDELNPGALTAGTLPAGGSDNDVLDALGIASLSGFFGSQISLSSAAKLTYTFIGFEAGYKNQFAAGADVFDTETFVVNNIANPAGLASFTQDTSAGLLDFSFLTRGGASGIVNGDDNTSFASTPDFFASIIGDPTSLSGTSLFLFLDDRGGGPDDDHDDFVVRIDIDEMIPVPLPAAGFMLAGTALAGMGLMRRRRKS